MISVLIPTAMIIPTDPKEAGAAVQEIESAAQGAVPESQEQAPVRVPVRIEEEDHHHKKMDAEMRAIHSEAMQKLMIEHRDKGTTDRREDRDRKETDRKPVQDEVQITTEMTGPMITEIKDDGITALNLQTLYVKI